MAAPYLFEFLDFLSANANSGIIHVIQGYKSQVVDWPGMFKNAGDYYLTISVSAKEARAAAIKIKFKWALDPTTSELTAIA
ncbi:hypothetical protein [Bradyrhizobium sp. USDA 3364]